MEYRAYLRDYYSWKKRCSPVFSYQVFAQKAGFGSKSFLAHVIDGKRDLSRESVSKVARAIEMNEKEMAYFEDLVAYNQSADAKQRSQLLVRLASYKQATRARFIHQNQLEYFKALHHSTIRELVTFFDFDGDYAALGKRLQPPLTAKQARESVALLLKLGLIEKAGGKYRQTDAAVTTGDHVRSAIVHDFHAKNLRLAEAALESVAAAERDISCMIVGLSQDGFDALKAGIRRFRKEVAELADRDADAERVYHVSFQLFPTSTRGEDRS
jgi:uncharacterized protein (TIGR02147 family)